MKTVRIKDLDFSVTLPAHEIQNGVEMVAKQINQTYAGEEITFLGILNGSFMFASDLLKHIEGKCTISFLKLSSYQGARSSGVTKELIGLNESLEGKHVIIIEDIVDTGHTLMGVLAQLKQHRPASLKVATLLFKSAACEVSLPLDYVVFKIPNDFVVGYGLDYDGYGRNLPDIYTVVER
jgi:hypoxanthine phosphoribosyltransferase